MIQKNIIVMMKIVIHMVIVIVTVILMMKKKSQRNNKIRKFRIRNKRADLNQVVKNQFKIRRNQQRN